MVLGFGEMREEDKPSEEIWLDEPRLADHFAALRNERRDEADDSKWRTAAQRMKPNASPRVRDRIRRMRGE